MAWRIIETQSSSVGASAAEITTTTLTASAVWIHNTHATQTLYIDATSETADANAWEIAPGDKEYFEIEVGPDAGNGFSIFGSGASTTYKIIFLG